MTELILMSETDSLARIDPEKAHRLIFVQVRELVFSGLQRTYKYLLKFQYNRVMNYLRKWFGG